MAGVPVIAEKGGLGGLLLSDLDRLQWKQFQHDEKYHREIARLTVQDRLKHMALHFAKYAGNLLEAQGNEAALHRILTDILIIGTSTANILNVRLSEQGDQLRIGGAMNDLASAVIVSAGRMAAACEKMDHLEAFPFREAIAKANLELIGIALAFFEQKRISPEEAISQRLLPVKKKSIFYGKI